MLFKTHEYLGSRIGKMPPSTETSGKNSLRRPVSTKGCRASDDDDDDDDDVESVALRCPKTSGTSNH
jgi:hypothetical protein